MIALSAGHYPAAPGACWPADNHAWCEHDLAAHWVGQIALLVRQRVEVQVVPSGWLGDKVRFINSLKNCQLAVELHFNSSPSAKARGCETLYCPGSDAGRRAAEAVQEYLAQVFPPSRGVKPGWHRMDLPGHVDYQGDVEGDEKVDYFLGKTGMVALIVEPEFIFNRVTLEKLEQSGCAALAEGILAAYDQLT